ncbi:hypothetical protein V8E36_008731, partial [Tilletia maclaganii]
MAPKKRKDPEVEEERGTVSSHGNEFEPIAEGQAQTPGLDDDELEQELAREHEGFDAENDNRTKNSDGTATPRPQNHENMFQDMTLEELELELELKTIRMAILKKKKNQKTPPLQDSTPIDTDSVLRERQNERLRRAGLLPPRDRGPIPNRPSPNMPRVSATPVNHNMRYPSVSTTVIMHGIEKKILDIMNSTDQNRPHTSNPGDKSELSKAGIKVAAPEKWKGDRSLQTFTDWTHAIAHYFKVHAPLSEGLKVDLIG